MIDLIRGQNVSRALSILKFTDKRAALPIAKCLNSAIANATFLAEQQNIAIDPDDLWVNLCFIDMGPHKHRSRMRPAPQGRAYREQRHYCHITIQVTSEEKAKSAAELALEEARAARIAARKAAKAAKPKAPKKEAKAPKVEEEKVVVPEAEEVVETAAAEASVEAPVEEAVETPAEVVEAKTETETVEEIAETPAEAETSAGEVVENTDEDLETK